jgi:hypothetical protein
VWRNLPSGGLLQDAYLTEDHRHVVQVNSDGGLHVHRISDGKTVLHGRIVEDEIAVWTDDFHFDATAEAAAAIDLRFPGLDGQFSLDRFATTRRVPGLAAMALAGEVPRAPAPPVPPMLEAKIAAVGDEVELSATLDPKHPAEVIEIYQDGVLPIRSRPRRLTMSCQSPGSMGHAGRPSWHAQRTGPHRAR